MHLPDAKYCPGGGLQKQGEEVHFSSRGRKRKLAGETAGTKSALFPGSGRNNMNFPTFLVVIYEEFFVTFLPRVEKIRSLARERANDLTSFVG